MWNPKLLAVSAILFITSLAGTAWYAYSSGKQSGMLQIQTRWDAERLAQQQAILDTQQKARQTEQELQAQVDKIRRGNADEKRRIAAQYERTIAGLRDRPERPSTPSVPEGAVSGTGSPSGCTGAQLYREDAAVALGIARDADRLRLALKSCIAHTAEIERQLNRLAP